MIVKCCQIDVSATDCSLAQRSPTGCAVSLCVIKKPQKYSWMRRRPKPTSGLSRQKKVVEVPLLEREAGVLFENLVPFCRLYTMNLGVSNSDVFGKSQPTVK